MKRILPIFLFLLASINGYSVKQILLNVKANYMVYSKTQDKLYATVSGTDMIYGNELLVINPYSGAIEKEVYVGSEPNEIKFSSDESYLYVVLNGTPQIVRLQAPSLTIDKYIQVNTAYTKKQYFAKHITVVTNSPKDIVVSRSESGYVQDVSLFRDGVLQKDSIGYFPAYSISVLLSGTQPDVIYGYNDQSTGYDFSVMQITPTGLKFTKSYPSLVSGFSIPSLINNKIYSNSGEVVDLSLTPPIQIAKCMLGSSYYNWQVAVNDSLTRITYASFNYWSKTLLHLEHFSNKRFNLTAIEDIDIPGLSTMTSNGQIGSFNYTKKRGMAFIVADSYAKTSQVVILPDASVSSSVQQIRQSEISVYPNPAVSTIHVNGEYTALDVFDAKGCFVERVSGTDLIDISGYSSGVYYLKINDGSETRVIKLLKQ